MYIIYALLFLYISLHPQIPERRNKSRFEVLNMLSQVVESNGVIVVHVVAIIIPNALKYN